MGLSLVSESRILNFDKNNNLYFIHIFARLIIFLNSAFL